MAGYVPYRQPQSGMNYAQLMQLMQMKQMMEAQGQQQGQAKAPTSGIGDLLSSFGGGSAGGAISNLGGSGGASTVGADVLSLGQTMPQVGPTIGNAAALPAGNTLGLSGMGAGPMALGALGAGAFLSNIYEGGGKDIIRGKGKGSDYANLMLDINPVTAPINMGLRAFGMKSVGKMLGGHKSTKQRQGERWQGLAKDGKVPDWFLEQDVTQDQGVDDRKLASGKLGGRDVWATSGMFDTFGKDWATSGDENKREQVAKLMLDNKLFDTKQGVTNVTDKNKAMEIYNRVMGGGGGGSSSNTSNPLTDPSKKWQTLPAQIKGPGELPSMSDISSLQSLAQNGFGQTGQQPTTSQWTRKDSPGFKDGKRIDYSKRSR